eukprot:9471344-Pyramimonas_sp.AAC.1
MSLNKKHVSHTGEPRGGILPRLARGGLRAALRAIVPRVGARGTRGRYGGCGGGGGGAGWGGGGGSGDALPQPRPAPAPPNRPLAARAHGRAPRLDRRLAGPASCRGAALRLVDGVRGAASEVGGGPGESTASH